MPIRPGRRGRTSSRTARRCADWELHAWARATRGAVTGPWGSLSVVTGPFADRDIVDEDERPAARPHGDDTGQTLAGRRDGRADRGPGRAAPRRPTRCGPRAARRPIPCSNGQYPGKFGFGALRCAVDVLNGDNVEWIGYPTGAKHVFCYAYYVVPPPTSGTIVDPQGRGRPGCDRHAVVRLPGRHLLHARAGASRSRRRPVSRARRPSTARRARRGRGASWTFPGGCGRPVLPLEDGRSQTRTDAATGAVSVDLAAADTVTCTHTDRPVPPPSGLLLSKVTRGGIGSFDFDVSGPDKAAQTIATTDAGHAGGGAAADADAGDVRRRREAAGARAGRQLVARARHVRRQAAGDPADRHARVREGHGVRVHQRVHARRLDHAAQAHRGRCRRGGLHHPAARAAGA